MSKRELLKRIEELESRVAMLEARPLFPMQPWNPQPWQPLQPWCQPADNTGTPPPPWPYTTWCAT